MKQYLVMFVVIAVSVAVIMRIPAIRTVVVGA